MPPSRQLLITLTMSTKKASSPDSPGGERMELEDETEDCDGSMDRPGSDKVCLTQVYKSTEEFLRKVYTSVSNADRRQLRQCFIVLDTPFSATTRLDKNLKSADTSLSRIQVLFLDAVGPLSDLLDKVNNSTKLSVEDMEGAVKGSFNLHRQCLLTMHRTLQNWDP